MSTPDGGWGGPVPPPPSSWNQPSPWSQQPQGWVREHPDGTTVLVLGILSLVVCGFLGPFAWSKGNHALAEIDANPGAWSNRGNVNAGRICGMIASILLVVQLVIVGALIITVIASAASST